MHQSNHKLVLQKISELAAYGIPLQSTAQAYMTAHATIGKLAQLTSSISGGHQVDDGRLVENVDPFQELCDDASSDSDGDDAASESGPAASQCAVVVPSGAATKSRAFAMSTPSVKDMDIAEDERITLSTGILIHDVLIEVGTQGPAVVLPTIKLFEKMEKKCTGQMVRMEQVPQSLNTLAKVCRAVLGALLSAPPANFIRALLDCFKEWSAGKKGSLTDCYAALHKSTGFRQQAGRVTMNSTACTEAVNGINSLRQRIETITVDTPSDVFQTEMIEHMHTISTLRVLAKPGAANQCEARLFAVMGARVIAAKPTPADGAGVSDEEIDALKEVLAKAMSSWPGEHSFKDAYTELVASAKLMSATRNMRDAARIIARCAPNVAGATSEDATVTVVDMAVVCSSVSELRKLSASPLSPDHAKSVESVLETTRDGCFAPD